MSNQDSRLSAYEQAEARREERRQGHSRLVVKEGKIVKENAPGEDRVQWAEKIGEWLVKWQRQDASVYDLADMFLTRLREVETLWEGAEAVIASQCKEMVEIVDKLDRAEQQRDDWRRMAEQLEYENVQARERE